jgi:hypothetical protein
MLNGHKYSEKKRVYECVVTCIDGIKGLSDEQLQGKGEMPNYKVIICLLVFDIYPTKNRKVRVATNESWGRLNIQKYVRR